MPAWARPFIAAIIAPIVAGLAALFASKGIDINKDTQAQIVEYLVGVILPLFGLVAGVTHKIVAARVNPGDAATSQLAEEHVHENNQLKAADSNLPSVIH